jgi:F0F1-type ATP synthase alpha subunit
MQVIHILAGTEGFCDDIETTEVNNFIDDLTDHFEKSQSEMLKEIVERGTLKKEGLRQRVLAEIKAFRQTWN